MLTRYLKRLLNVSNIPLLLATVLLLLAPFIKPVNLNRPAYTYQIGFDISQSMNVQDMMLDGKKLTRLDYAKIKASDLVQALPCGSRVGWSVFTGRRTLTLLTPLEVCDHYSGLLASLEEVDGRMRWSNGSSIGKGIHQIMRAADEFTDPTAIIFMTDGQEAPPLEQGQRGVPNTDKLEVSGLLVGVGGEQALPIPKFDAAGNSAGFWTADEVVQRVSADYSGIGEEFSRRDDERLLALARFTNLQYTTLTSTKSLLEHAKDSRYAQSRPTQTDLRWLPASLALLLLVIRFSPKPGLRGLQHRLGRLAQNR